MHMYRLFLYRDFSVALFFIYGFLQFASDGGIIFPSADSSWLIQGTCSLSDTAGKLQHKFGSVFKIENTNGFKLEYFIETLRFTSNLF